MNDISRSGMDGDPGTIRIVATTAQRRLRLDTLAAQLREGSGLASGYLQRLAQEGLDLALALEDHEGVALCCKQLGYCKIQLGIYTEGLDHLRQALRLYLRLQENREAAGILLAIGSSHMRLNKYDVAIASFRESLELAAGEGDAEGRAAALAAIGNALSALGEYATALEHQLEALAIRETLDDSESLGIVCNDIGLLYAQIGDSSTALEFFNRSLGIFRDHGRRYLELRVLGNMGGLHLVLGDHAAALDAAVRTLVIHQQFGDQVGQAESLIAIATCQEQSRHLQEALAGFQQALELAGKGGHRQLQGAALMGLGNCHRKQGEYWTSVAELDMALKIGKDIGDRRLELLAHESLSMTYERLGEPDSALEHYKEFVRMRDDLQGDEKRRAVTATEVRFALARTERERDQYRVKAEELQGEVERKSRELNALTLNMMQKNEMLDALKGQLARAPGDTAEARSVMKSVIEEIDATMDDGEQKRGAEEGLFELHREFIKVLAEQYPQLSTTEIKVCVLLKLNMATKEIANLLYLSERTVENHRYRVRRKMGLPADTNLMLHLAGL